MKRRSTTHGTAQRGRESRPLWLLALACALIPAGAVGFAWWLSVRAGHIPDCIPHLEGCTSISRAARHGTGNLVFKFTMTLNPTIPDSLQNSSLGTSTIIWEARNA